MKSKSKDLRSRLDYDALIAAISRVHEQAQTGAAGAVNRYLVIRNWIIGAYIVEYEQNGADRAAYGSLLLKRLASDLRQRRIGGTSPDMIERMRLFYMLYPRMGRLISAPVVRESCDGLPANELLLFSPKMLRAGRSGISAPVVRKSHEKQPPCLKARDILRFTWTHLAELVRLDDPWKRAFYENECLRGNWSKRQLQRQIGSLLYERTGLSADKKAIVARARRQAAESPEAVAELIRDPYILEFTGLADRPRYHESDLETALLDHLQSFLLELGAGFCFEARQKRVTVANEHDYIDLVFYNRLLRCHLLIDLKVRAFRHADAGQLNFYLNYWKAEVMAEGDNLPVGLILCTDKDDTKVEYATAGLDRRLFVSRYLVALPKPEQLKRLIEAERAVWEQTRKDKTQEALT